MLPDYIGGGTAKEIYTQDEVIDVACPCCGSTEGPTIAVENGSIGIKRCAKCELIYTSPQIHEPAAVYWGDHDTYLAEARLIYAGTAPHHRDPNYIEELKLLERHVPARGRLLDVGCNMGRMLSLARPRGWETVGVEPSPALSRLAREQFGLTVYNCFLNEVPDEEKGTFDALTTSDVFEHVPDPREFLRDAKQFLKPDGVLYIKVPNARWKIFKQRVAGLLGREVARGAWDAFEDLAHYTDATLATMLESEGFSSIEMTLSRPVQIPVWHEYVGHYYQYPSPWLLDPKRYLGRAAFHAAARTERQLRSGSIGYLAPNLVAIARPA
jgi:2-polyprenyl-3-methyl-5-hydroxy-6-metoxy-1,4-benzoquinol methylase